MNAPTEFDRRFNRRAAMEKCPPRTAWILGRTGCTLTKSDPRHGIFLVSWWTQAQFDAFYRGRNIWTSEGGDF